MKMETIKPLAESQIAVIGLGYVGLPLAVEFGKKFPTVGFDINADRVGELVRGIDSTLEVEDNDLKNVLVTPQDIRGGKEGLHVTTNNEELKDCNVFVVTVPTPTDKHNRPVLTPMLKASETVAALMKKGDVIIYESTVYPGVTEDECVPVLERISKLKFNEDFYVGYSPERINPGDKHHTVSKILKVTSGSNEMAANYVDALYQSIIIAGTHKAPSIKVAEASKVIENSQRDVNIAFVNELAMMFNLMGIDTHEVLEAAGTKWNFLKFKPGLVGGHCIGVDPYYLSQKAQEVGYHAEMILAGRRINDGMGKHVATEVVKKMMKKNLNVMGTNALILGFTFKEDCPDIRNTRVIDIFHELKGFDMGVSIYDPWVDADEVRHEYGIDVISGNDEIPDLSDYEAIVLAVAHKEFQDLDISKSPDQVVYDVKAILPKEKVDGRL